MAGYSRQSASTIVDGRTVAASDLNDEFNQIALALSPGGHTHDGSVGNGPQITTAGLANLSVTTAKVANNAITSDKIASSSVTPAKLDATGAYTVGSLTATTATATNLVIGSSTAVTSVDTDLSSVAATDTTLASAKAIKSYVDTAIAGSAIDPALTIAGDTGGDLSIDLDSETLTLVGGTGVSTSGSGNAITINIDNTFVTTTGAQTLTNKTLTAPVISSISNTGTLTLPTATGTLALTSQIPTNNNQLTNGAGYLTAESDPVFTASAASGITSTKITNWDTAYGWGNHASAGYITSESDPVVGAISGLVKADGAGNISAAVAGTDYLASETYTGTVTSVGGTGTVSGLTLSGTVTTSGNLTLGGTLSVLASNINSQTATDGYVLTADGSGGVAWEAVSGGGTNPSPTLTIDGDASGSATFTELGDATLTLTIADDSHNHTISNIDNLQSALDAKAALASTQTFTANNAFQNEVNVGRLSEKYVNLSGTTHTIYTNGGAVYYLSTGSNQSINFSTLGQGYTSTSVYAFALVIESTGNFLISWPSNVYWPNGSAPAAPTNGTRNVYVFFKLSGVATYFGFLAGSAMTTEV